MSRVEFDAVYAFNYSKRAGTAAAALDDDVSPEKKRERITKLLSMQDGISVRKNAAYLGKEFRALVEGESKVAGMYTARTDTNKLVHIPSAEQYIGQFVKIKITETGAYDLFGEIINK